MTPADRRLLRATRGARRHIAATVGLGIVSAALTVAAAALLATVLARAFQDGDGVAELRTPLLVLAAVLAARALTSGLMEVSGRIGAARSLSELRRRMLEHVLVRRPGALAAERTGELASTAVQGVDALEAWFARYLPQAVLSGLVPPLLLAYLVTRDVESTLVLAVTLPLVPLFMVLVGVAARSAAERRFATLSLLGAHFLDVVRGLPTLRAFRRERVQEEQIAAVTEAWRRESMGTLRVAFLSALVLELLASLGTAVTAGVVGLQLAEGALGLTAGLTVLILAPDLYAPLRALGQQYHASADGLAAAERLFAVLDLPAALAPVPSPRPAPDPRAEPVHVDGVTFAHPGRDAAALAGVSLALAPGATTALTGPSGAGKSTLAGLVVRLADPAEGRVRCGATDLRDVAPEDWWARVAWVPQRAHMLPGTLRENVRLGAPHADDAAVAAALRTAGLGPLLAALPAGLDTVIGEGGRRLSAGEARRVALARAVVRDARLVVLDEPTAHLDEATAAGVRSAVARLCRGRTALVVTHDEALAALADRQVRLEGGGVPLPVAA